MRLRDCCPSFFFGRWIGPVVVAGVLGTALHCGAQASAAVRYDLAGELPMADAVPAAAAAVELPDAPEPQQQQTTPDPDANKPLVAATPKMVSQNTAKPVAPKFSKYIPAGYAVEQIHGREKLILGARDLYSVGDIGDWFLSAGWEQIWNGQPNYGTDRGAFGERLGAAVIRESTQGILTDGVFCVMLHQDPRYFVQGEQTSFMHRVVYVVTRPLVTRSSNDGHAMPNYSLWLGLASATALTNVYYPPINRNAKDNASQFGGAIGGSALGYAFDEFSGDLLKMLHRKRGQ